MLFKLLEALPKYQQKLYQEALIAEWTYTSTGLEGNTFTLGETDFFLKEGLTIAGKSLREHCEIRGHANAIQGLEKIIIYSKQLTKEDLFYLHRIIQTDIVVDIDNPVGKWKKEINGTYSRDHDGNMFFKEYPHPESIPELMDQWIKQFNSKPLDSYIRDDAYKFYAAKHLSFVSIHPFADGNGRMARLICNFPLLCSGLPPLIIPKEWRQEYIALLSEYQNNSQQLEKELFDNSEYLNFEKFCQKAWDKTWLHFDNLISNNQKEVNDESLGFGPSF